MARTESLWETAGLTGSYIQTIAPSGFDILINGTSKYLNFNSTVGVNGYGFRDNAGVMEFRDFGGSWTSFAGGGGSGTVTSFAFTNGSGFTGTVATSTTTPTLSLTTSLTTGSIPFIGASGALLQDNSNLRWDNSFKYFGIGTIPQSRLDVRQADTGLTTAGASLAFFKQQSSYNTTATARSNYAVLAVSQATKSAGANALTNIGLYASASSGDFNYSILFEGGIIAAADNSYDIGLASDSRPRTGYFATSIVVPQVFNADHAIAAVANAATVTRAFRNNVVTNNSAAGITITLSTSGATAGDMILVKSLPFSNVAQAITWVNVESSDIPPSANLNADTTLPRTDGFEWNPLTSKWRCIGSA